MAGDGPVFTDNGNMIADAHTGPNIEDPVSTEANTAYYGGCTSRIIQQHV